MFDNETIEVTLFDNDSGIAVLQAFVQVMNLVPTATFIPDVVIDPMFIPLHAIASDAGADPLAYNWVASVNGLTIQTGTGPAFVLDRTLYASATIVISLPVSDDDLAQAGAKGRRCETRPLWLVYLYGRRADGKDLCRRLEIHGGARRSM